MRPRGQRDEEERGRDKKTLQRKERRTDFFVLLPSSIHFTLSVSLLLPYLLTLTLFLFLFFSLLYSDTLPHTLSLQLLLLACEQAPYRTPFLTPLIHFTQFKTANARFDSHRPG